MKHQPKSSAFTLVELMIALGILAIGLTMIATAFPTGVRNVNDAWDDTMVTLIAENGLAITRAKLTHTRCSVPGGVSSVVMSEQTFPFGAAILGIAPGIHQGDLIYPIGSLTSRYSWRVCMYRPVPTGAAAIAMGQTNPNLYQVMIAVHRKNTPVSQPPTTKFGGLNVNRYTGNLDVKLGAVSQWTFMGYYTVRTGLAP